MASLESFFNKGFIQFPFCYCIQNNLFPYYSPSMTFSVPLILIILLQNRISIQIFRIIFVILSVHHIFFWLVQHHISKFSMSAFFRVLILSYQFLLKQSLSLSFSVEFVRVFVSDPYKVILQT